jgi:hypothetical protein
VLRGAEGMYEAARRMCEEGEFGGFEFLEADWDGKLLGPLIGDREL